jgi:hypothetical protein
LALLGAVVMLAACGGSSVNHGSSTPLSVIELKYRLIAQLGPLQYCDSDSYPLARPVTAGYISTRLSEISKNDPQNYEAILSHYHLTPPLTEAQEAQVYSDYKVLAAFQLSPVGDIYDFAYPVRAGGAFQATLTSGSIDKTGSLTIKSKTPTSRPCPICLAAWTTIDTPTGPVLVTKLVAGMSVWTQGASGHRQKAVVVKVGSMVAPIGHEVVHLVLADGRELWASPGHPLADGRPLGLLVAGDRLDGSPIVKAERVPYAGSTFDLLPSGPTGVYWANGVPLRSTLYTKMSSGNTADTT